tara:strand:- start:15773 stop:15982 length:210 start_codon:yes stop_codon:yes gene_type:complete
MKIKTINHSLENIMNNERTLCLIDASIQNIFLPSFESKESIYDNKTFEIKQPFANSFYSGLAHDENNSK